MKKFSLKKLITSVLMMLSMDSLLAHEITSAQEEDKTAAFDITLGQVTTDSRLTTFIMELAGIAGSVKPESVGQLKGAKVESYVWPTSLDPSVVGFEKDSGTLALAITAHPDFDDTPLFDENNDGDPANDGSEWHSHWVVLVEDQTCGAGLKVRDVSPGADLLPKTAPGLPIALDSPGMSPTLDQNTARIVVPIGNTEGEAFDAVTAELQVHHQAKTPLLCVTQVHDIASKDMSLPGRIVNSEN